MKSRKARRFRKTFFLFQTESTKEYRKTRHTRKRPSKRSDPQKTLKRKVHVLHKKSVFGDHAFPDETIISFNEGKFHDEFYNFLLLYLPTNEYQMSLY